jgi:peptidoglycan/LPS O-acetylase OafA/YrhL
MAGFDHPRQHAHRYHTLDGLRGLAAISVLIRHGGGATALVYHSYLAVDLFFVISGFVLCASYDQGLVNRSLPFTRFMKLRFIRLYPIFLLGSILGLAGGLLNFWLRGDHFTSIVPWLPQGPLAEMSSSFLLALFMLPTPFCPTLYILNGPTWTLFYEMIVNIFYGLARPRIAAWLCIAAIACGGIYIIWFLREAQNLDDGWRWSKAEIAVARAVFSFGIGVILFKYRTRMHGAFPALLQKHGNVFSLGAMTAALLLLACPTLGSWDAFYDKMMIFIILPLLVLGASFAKPGNAFLVTYYDLLGRASYPLYVMQAPVSALAAVFFAYEFGIRLGDHTAVATPILLAVLLPLSVVLDYLYDQPSRLWLRKKLLNKN